MTKRTVRSRETGQYFAGGPPSHPQFTEHRSKAWESDRLSAAMTVFFVLQRRGIGVDIVADGSVASAKGSIASVDITGTLTFDDYGVQTDEY